MKFLKKYQHTWIIPIYGILYMLAFQYVEQRKVPVTIIHMKIDDYIPFCEYFVVPYFLWFGYIALTVFYFAFMNQNKKEYWQLILTLGIGMTLFIVISILFPNGQDLRPNLTVFLFRWYSTYIGWIRLLIFCQVFMYLTP